MNKYYLLYFENHNYAIPFILNGNNLKKVFFQNNEASEMTLPENYNIN